jgi:hypothetical protein
MKSPSRLITLATFVALALPAFAQNGKPDSEGFLRDWLVLAPVSTAGSTGGEEIDRKQFPEEALPAAKEGAKQKVGDRELTWKKVAAPEFHLDFVKEYPSENTSVIAWAVAYVVSPAEKTGLTLHMNSNDQGKVYLNGTEVVKFAEPDGRTLEKGAEDKAPNITLKAGVNVVVLKVINGDNNWQGSVRFMDKDGKPVTDLKVQTKKD